MSKNINETINLNELVVTPQGASFSSNKTGVQPTTTKYWRIKVKPGDNLTKLANQYNTTVDELVKINNLKDPNSIYAGLDLRVVSREKENKNYASDYIQAVKNIAEVRKIDTRHAAALLDELISQGAVKFDGTPQFIMPSKASTESKVQGYKTKEARERDTRSKDFNFTKTYVANQNAAWKRNPEVMQAFKDAGDATGYGAAGVAAIPYIPSILPHLPGIARDMVIYNQVIDPLTEYTANKMKLTGKQKSLYKNIVGFGTSGLSSSLLDRGSVKLFQLFRNYLDKSASKATSHNTGIKLTELANKVENAQNVFLKISNPLRTLNTRTGIQHGLTTFGENALGGAVYTALEDYSPIGAEIVSSLTPRISTKGVHETKFLAGINSRGAQDVKQLTKKIKQHSTPYNAIQHTTSNATRQLNGNQAAFGGVNPEGYSGGMQHVAHKQDGEIPLLYKWDSIHKGNTYNSPYWETVNPERFFASKMTNPYNGTGWMDRRVSGDAMDFFSPQSFEEFIEIAKTAKNKDGISMYDYLKSDNLNYDIMHFNKNTNQWEYPQGDLIIAENKNKEILSEISENKQKKKQVAERKGKKYKDKESIPVIAYNQKGHRESSEVFVTPDGTEIHLGSDFGGTGSGGATDQIGVGLKPFIMKWLKSSYDLGSYSLPVTGQIQIAKRNKKNEFTRNNVWAYHPYGLLKISAPRDNKKLFHTDN